MIRAKKTAILFILMLPLVVTACSVGGDNTDSEVTTLVYGNLTEMEWNSSNLLAITAFNRSHKDIKIVLRNYYDDENGRSGLDRFLFDVATGNMPDIIDLKPSTGLPYHQLAYKGHLENLWPYIENDPDIGPDGLVDAPIEAAKAGGGLYAVFKEFYIESVAGPASLVGERYSWSLDDLMACYETMPEGATILRDHTAKRELLPWLRADLNSYIDWDTGETFFDSVGFRTTLEFLNMFPDEYPPGYLDLDTNLKTREESFERLCDGFQMLDARPFDEPFLIRAYDRYLGKGEPVAFVGYPTGDGSVGSYFGFEGPVLGMSAQCKNKEAAWEFLRQMLLPQFDSLQDYRDNTHTGLPVNRSDFNFAKQNFLKSKNQTYMFDTAPTMKISLTSKEIERFEDLIDHVDKTVFYDRNIYNIVYEVATAYFAGDKTLDEAVSMIQQRVSLYMDEIR